jgi:hypothetical protein
VDFSASRSRLVGIFFDPTIYRTAGLRNLQQFQCSAKICSIKICNLFEDGLNSLVIRRQASMTESEMSVVTDQRQGPRVLTFAVVAWTPSWPGLPTQSERGGLNPIGLTCPGVGVLSRSPPRTSRRWNRRLAQLELEHASLRQRRRFTTHLLRFPCSRSASHPLSG